MEDVVPLVPDEVEGRVSADGVKSDGRDDAAAVLLSHPRVRREGHVQVPWKIKFETLFNHKDVQGWVESDSWESRINSFSPFSVKEL